MIRRLLAATAALALLAGSAQAVPTALTPPSISYGGAVQSVAPVQMIGYDGLSAAPCIVGASATCLLPSSSTASLAYQLLSNASATGAQTLVTVGRSYALLCTGTWNGGSVQLQGLGPDGVTWVNIGTALTSNGSTTMTVGAQTTVRAFVSGGPPSGMYCVLS